MSTVIQIDRVFKEYRLGQIGGKRLVDDVNRWWARLRDKEDPLSKVGAPVVERRNGNGKKLRPTPSSAFNSPNGSSSDHIWALKDVSFEVKQGEVLGLIGRNGAGKSTLLKILSRVTAPTSGEVRVKGRIASLLEVGTGFHPELTGRENIFLNGAILGMTKAEIRKKFDEIVVFSEVEQFIDTPVKRYSSGMYLKLAFAVAAHLDAEILVVDEVLSVGDMSFQRKCLNKMQTVGREGRTVLVVSHNMSAISRLCQRTIVLSNGSILADAPPTHAIGAYMNNVLQVASIREWPNLNTAPGNEVVKLLKVRVKAENGVTTDVIDIRHPLGIEIEYEVLQSGHVLIPNLHFFNEEGVNIFILHNFNSEWRNRKRPVGRYVSTAWLPGNFLSEGRVCVGAAISTYLPFITHFYEADAVTFHVVDDMHVDAARGDYKGHLPGVIRPIMPWTTEYESGRAAELRLKDAESSYSLANGRPS